MFKYNHNEHYVDLLLRQVPSGCQNVLDIGCGDGSLVQRVAERFNISVTGIDRDRAMIKRAQASTSNPLIEFIEGDFMQYHFDKQFDFISASASLHHMPFDQSLEKMASLMRPGGVLAIIGLFRKADLTDVAVELVAIPVNVFYALSRGWYYNGAPIKPFEMSLQEICERVAIDLPGAKVRRLLLWRYLLTWQKSNVDIRAY